MHLPKRHLVQGRIAALQLALGCVGLALMGCDDPKPVASEKATAPTPPPAAALPVAEPPKVTPPKVDPPKEWPKFADCKGKDFSLSSPELEGAIRVKAQKPEGDITKADLKRLRSLNLSRVPAQVFDICVLQFTPELRELAFGADQLGDLSAVAGLTRLESLSIGKNEISDLSPLAKLTKLDRLTLNDGKVTDISVLKALKLLTEVNFDGNPVVDISVLSGLKKLERVSLARTQVASPEPLRELKDLKSLHLKGSPLGDDIGATAFLVRNGVKVIRD
jgi:Leucine-rich repeat (LRR) protein